MTDQPDQNPAYGQISVTRWNSNNQKVFYGSTLKHDSGVTISIHKSERHRSLNRDYHDARGSIIDVDMTHAQFAEMITSLNMGGGTPCTITRSMTGPSMQHAMPEQQFKGEQLKAEAQQAGDDATELMSNSLKDFESLLNGGKINKTNLRSILNDFTVASQKLDDTMPFIVGKMTELMEKAVVDAGADMVAKHSMLAEQLTGDDVKKIEGGCSHDPSRTDSGGASSMTNEPVSNGEKQ